ncbi:MAG: hypothetical protein IJ716_14330 [Lachnospiraceae bacterium]|nr:hypothetical protein [Lachnospiraceae bacterium]
MAKFYGKIGFNAPVETAPGVWMPQIVERPYYGDVTRNTRRLEGNQVNDNIRVSNNVSIVADPFANENIYSMIYAVYMGAKWKITDVEVQYPRLILTLGGLYDGET